MSATATAAKHENKAATAGQEAHKAPAATVSHGDKGASTAPAAPTVTIEIASMQVTLPIKFSAGHVLTEAQAKILDAAYQRQFTNNQNALAKAREDSIAKAKTEEERKAKTEAHNAVTPAALAALYSTYEPNVGGTRRPSIERIKLEAAWRFWTDFVGKHNAALAAGKPCLIVKAGSNQVTLPSGKGAAEKRESMSERLLTLPEYADGIQAFVDIILAERGSKKETKETSAAVVASDSLL